MTSGVECHAPLAPGRLAGRTAIVSGATQGLGLDIARAFVTAGAGVVLADVNRAAGEEVARGLGANAMFVQTDVRDDGQIDRCVAGAMERFGSIDILVNSAAIYADLGLDSTREQWHQTLDVNLVSAAIFTRMVSAVMKPGSVIVNIGSVGGKFGAGARATYPASKAALLQITKNFAVALAPRGIRCLSVSPAWTWSPSMASMSQGSIETADAVGARFHPLGRVGRGEEVAAAVVFASSADASWITGVDLPVDGGFSCLGPDQGRSPREWFARFAESAVER